MGLWAETEAALSSFQALALIAACTVAFVYMVVSAAREARWGLMAVQTGFSDGAPLSIGFRWRLLWAWFFPSGIAVIALCVAGALVQIQIGANVDDTKVRNLAYFMASTLGVMAILWVLGLVGFTRHLVALLRNGDEN